MFAFAPEPGGTAMSLGSAHGESSKSAMGGTGNPVMRAAFSTKYSSARGRGRGRDYLRPQ